MIPSRRRSIRLAKGYAGGPCEVLRVISGLDARPGDVIDGQRAVTNAYQLIRHGYLKPVHEVEAGFDPTGARSHDRKAEAEKAPKEPAPADDSAPADEAAEEEMATEASSGDEWETLTVAELRNLLRESGVPVGAGLRKDDLISLARAQL
jgi:hypothetical protein